jgi:hypothetical protein
MPRRALLDPTMTASPGTRLGFFARILGVLNLLRKNSHCRVGRRIPETLPTPAAVAYSVGVSDSGFGNLRWIVRWTDVHQELTENPGIAQESLDCRSEQTTHGEVIPWYVPKTHNRMKYEKKIGKPASLTVPRLRGRELAFPDGRLISRLVVSEEDPSKLERLEMTV